MGILGMAWHLVLGSPQSVGHEEVFPRMSSSLARRPQTPISIDAAPIRVISQRIRGARYVAIIGGRPGSRLISGRQPVAWFIKEAGAQAGINGAFFVMAAIRSTNSAMIGPVLAENGPGFVPCKKGVNSEKLEGRPFIMWDDKQIAFIPYQSMMNEEEGARTNLPTAKGGFVAGAWLIQDGRVLTGGEIRGHGPRDSEQPRRRAMFGVTDDGRICLAAAADSVSSSTLAKAAKDFGCHDAALLDSGFSTSLVLGSKTLVSGHSTSKQPSRPVPHALVIYGDFAANQ